MQKKIQKKYDSVKKVYYERFGSNIQDWREDQKIMLQFMDEISTNWESFESFNSKVKFRTIGGASNVHVSDEAMKNAFSNSQPDPQSVLPQTDLVEKNEVAASELLELTANTVAARRQEKAASKGTQDYRTSKRLYESLTEMPNAFRTPWLVTWCTNEEDQTINHFSFTFINGHKIGRVRGDDCDICPVASTHELQIQNRISKILIQRKPDAEDGIQSILIIDDSGVVTSVNAPNTDIMFDQKHWKEIKLEGKESIIDMEMTYSFDNIEFSVCDLPKMKKQLSKPI